jgi:hypothetical protein
MADNGMTDEGKQARIASAEQVSPKIKEMENRPLI